MDYARAIKLSRSYTRIIYEYMLCTCIMGNLVKPKLALQSILISDQLDNFNVFTITFRFRLLSRFKNAFLTDIIHI